MTKKTPPKLIIAISSMALFDLSKSNQVYEQQGVNAYQDYQRQHENEILEPGTAFPLVKKLLDLNQQGDFVEIILLSRNSADTGLRVFNSIEHYNLPITRAAFTGGQSPFSYVGAFKSDLFLSANRDDVKQALDSGVAAAYLLPGSASTSQTSTLKIAFDGDAVLFSDDSERIYKEQGLDAFAKHEKQTAHEMLPGGPFRRFLAGLQHIQNNFPDQQPPIRTALVTARSAPSHERVIRTLRAWNIRIDEALFLGGLTKGEFLQAFDADIFFDDQQVHCESAAKHVATGHVVHGVANEESKT